MNKVLILLGPTGVGKTGASLLLAKELGTEIISTDSMQIYRGMDIGTAKPSIEEMSAVRHHLINVVTPAEPYSAGQYIEAIIPVIDALHRKGRIPIIAGGTGLYIKAITRGLFSGPSADWTLREELLSMEEASTGALYEYLSTLDPEAAGKIERNDIRRLVRALEVCLKSSGKMSLLQETLTKPLPYKFIKVGLTRDRKELYSMIDSRVDAMIQAGLAEEVRKVLRMGTDRTPLQAIGYKELARFFAGEISFDEAVRLIKRNSRRYAKRQFSWFKKEEWITWVDVSGIGTSEGIYRKIREALEEFHPEIFD